MLHLFVTYCFIYSLVLFFFFLLFRILSTFLFFLLFFFEFTSCLCCPCVPHRLFSFCFPPPPPFIISSSFFFFPTCSIHILKTLSFYLCIEYSSFASVFLCFGAVAATFYTLQLCSVDPFFFFFADAFKCVRLCIRGRAEAIAAQLLPPAPFFPSPFPFFSSFFFFFTALL